MSQEEKHIGQMIWEIAHKGEQPGMRFPVMSGVVVAGSVDMSACTCTVLLSVDDTDSPTTGGVLLNSVSGNVNGMLCFPADNSNVWVAEIDGPGKWGIIKTSDLVKMVVTIGSVSLTMTDGLIQFNDGSLGGLVELQKCEDNLNALKNYIKETLEPAIVSGMNAIGAAMAANGATGGTAFNGIVSGEVITFEDMENVKVKQG
jgi:hypothetical protein